MRRRRIYLVFFDKISSVFLYLQKTKWFSFFSGVDGGKNIHLYGRHLFLFLAFISIED
jgi:hypothetical protein